MKLLTKAIAKEAFKQYSKGSNMKNQKIVAKFFDPQGGWDWYLMNLDPKDPDYAYGIVKGFEVEIGSWSMRELQSIKKPPLGLGIERDLYFEPINAEELWNQLTGRKQTAEVSNETQTFKPSR